MGRGSGSAWIMAGTLAFAGGSSALLSPTPVHSTVVKVQVTSAKQTSFTLDTYLPRHHYDGAEDEAGY
jgi:hypothetical protein